MIKNTIYFILLFVAGLFHAQTGTENYVQSKDCLDADCVKRIETVQYFDGLGRPKQVVNVKASPLGRDVVGYIEYDGFGRQVKDYLPVPQSGTLNGAIVPTPLANVPTTPYGSEKIYGEKIIESSPLNRVIQQIQPGTAWAAKPVNFGYALNTDSEVRKYTTTTNTVESRTNSLLKVADDSGALNGYYKISQLYKNSVKDEDGNETIEFKNSKDQTVLVRKVLSALEKADTYYVYNKYDQLAFVIPPKASDAVKALSSGTQIPDATLNDLCYQYRYDGDGKLVEKKLPGKGWEYMVYDKADRLVLTQDANMKVQNNWLFTKYDQFGRVVFTGITNNTATRQTLQTNLTAATYTNEVRSANFFTVSGMPIYYTNRALPGSLAQVLSINYYDTYPPEAPSSPSQVIGQEVLKQAGQSTISKNTRSLPLATYVKNIEDDNWTKSFTWYDLKGRPIATHSINHLGGYTRTETELDFAGKAKQTKTYHKRLDTDSEKVITETFTYDNQNRLLVHKHKIDNNPEEILTQNKYNELSQLESKKVGGTNPASPLQTVDYKYNVRGWMTQINDPANLGSDLFGYKINYNQVEGLAIPNSDYPDLQVKAKYNGNIAEVSWKTLTEDNEPLKRYGYSYDTLNRLSAGFYQKAGSETAKEYFEKIDYDLNGNIARLKRSEGLLPGNTVALAIDNLKYDYMGNRLTKVTDEQQNASGYPYIVTPYEITYDANGNMIRHRDKGLESIEYNYLNLPHKITGASGKNQKFYNYAYRADGAKISKSYSRGAETWSTDYLDGFQYNFYTGPTPPITTSDLKFVPTSEGYYDFENNTYIYNYTDHLGNVRLSYTDTNKDGTIQPRQYKVQQCDGPPDPMNPPNCVDYWKPGEIVEINNYYPFGLLHDYTTTTQNAYQYKYNGKELQETGMYDYGARFYMPDLGRWGVVDQLAEKSRRFSPYAYALDNPIMFIDPDGREAERCCSWNDVKAFGRGAWNTTKSMVKGTIENASLQKAAIVGVINLMKTYDAYKKGGVKGATRQAANVVYEETGAKALVQTAKSAIKGDPEAIGSLVVTVGAVVATHKAAGKISTITETETTTLHRGVNSTSPAYSQAVEGTATPRGGTATPLEHNTITTESNFTSWTTNPAVAENFALRTSGEGVVLTADIPNSQLVQSPNLKSVNLVQSPGTIVSESETLVKGPISGAQVRKVNLER